MKYIRYIYSKILSVVPVIFGVTDEGYETLSVNFANIRNYIIMNRNVIKLYKEYYEGEEDGERKED